MLILYLIGAVIIAIPFMLAILAIANDDGPIYRETITISWEITPNSDIDVKALWAAQEAEEAAKDSESVKLLKAPEMSGETLIAESCDNSRDSGIS